MKMYAVARIYMDNFPHLKAYWPMLGRQNAQLSLSFGVNDIDGTIDDTTKIYSMAGAEEQNPSMTTEELVALIKQVKREPVERDTLYNEIKNYAGEDVQLRKPGNRNLEPASTTFAGPCSIALHQIIRNSKDIC